MWWDTVRVHHETWSLIRKQTDDSSTTNKHSPKWMFCFDDVYMVLRTFANFLSSDAILSCRLYILSHLSFIRLLHWCCFSIYNIPLCAYLFLLGRTYYSFSFANLFACNILCTIIKTFAFHVSKFRLITQLSSCSFGNESPFGMHVCPVNETPIPTSLGSHGKKLKMFENN